MLIVACGIPKPSLITNRIYRTKEKTDNYWGYIKFYSDSTLINVSSSGRPKHLVTWFNKEKENVSKGKYNIKNDSIYFESISKSGKVYFEGIILNKKLILKSKSEINGFEDMKTYVLTRK